MNYERSHPDETVTQNLEDIARRIRGQIVKLSHQGGAPHLGSALSCVDILVAAYWSVLCLDPDQAQDPLRDRFILSKGHAAMALYVTLAERGFFPESLLSSFNQDGSLLAEHPSPSSVPGIEAGTGSLGHGLGLGLGMALASKIKRHMYRVFVLLSDGECNEGSTWEAAMMAPAHGLGNLCAIIDFNKWQATGKSQEVLALDSLSDKWSAFGWQMTEVDGHDITELKRAMSLTSGDNNQPIAIVAHTVKGKGISFMEDDNNWHYRIPSDAEVAMAFSELGLEK